MSCHSQLLHSKEQLLQAIAALGPMRKGSVCLQVQKTRRKSGEVTRRGPYPMYTCKKGGKTVGKRLSEEEARAYRAQIDAFRRFQQLCREFVDVAERLADLEAADLGEGKKNSSRASKRSKQPKRPASSKP